MCSPSPGCLPPKSSRVGCPLFSSVRPSVTVRLPAKSVSIVRSPFFVLQQSQLIFGQIQNKLYLEILPWMCAMKHRSRIFKISFFRVRISLSLLYLIVKSDVHNKTNGETVTPRSQFGRSRCKQVQLRTREIVGMRLDFFSSVITCVALAPPGSLCLHRLLP